MQAGFVRKSIASFATEQAPFASFEVLQDVYSKMSKPEHRRNIIQVYNIEGHAGPQLLNDVYTVHLAPVGVPCQGAPTDLRILAGAVSGVLRGLAALHSEGTWGFLTSVIGRPTCYAATVLGRYLASTAYMAHGTLFRACGHARLCACLGRRTTCGHRLCAP